MRVDIDARVRGAIDRVSDRRKDMMAVGGIAIENAALPDHHRHERNAVDATAHALPTGWPALPHDFATVPTPHALPQGYASKGE